MWTAFVVIAESSQTWTPETFYIAAGVIQLILLLVFFRIMQLPAEYASFINGLIVVVPVNLVAYFTKDLGLVGILITGSLMFVVLAAVTRGDVLNAIGGWLLMIAVYWGAAYFIVPAEPDLYIEQIGNIPQVTIEGGLPQETMTEEAERFYENGDED